LRYLYIDDITFETLEGQSIVVKDMRRYPEYATLTNYKLQKGEDLDEIISRQEYYGDGQESNAYAMVDINIVKLFESQFDLDKIKTIKIPVL